MRTLILVPALAAGLFAGGIAPATAAPPEPEGIQVVCDNGDSFEVEVNGNGIFMPGRIIGSTGVLIPTAFGGSGFRAVTPDGTVTEVTFPGEDLKGGASVAQRNPRPAVQCTYSETFVLTEADPEFQLPAGTVVTIFGTVTGYLVGR